MLAIGFVPSGLTKVFGVPFTKLDPATSSVGYFFDALHQAGFLYNFIGICQITAALLLLVPRTATLGALMYLPIIIGIEIITISMNFRGTWIITSLMLLGVIYLLCWDWHKLKYILVSPTV